MIRINLILQKTKPETIESLRVAQPGAFKLLVFHLKNENKLQQDLIQAYRVYFNFMERRLNNSVYD